MPAPPRATYRLQLRGGMDFARAASLAPYLRRLGVSHVYLSPPFTAAPGSTHGYDVVDPTQLDPELGGEEGFMLLHRALDEHGLGLVLDIVPNHMGIGRANAWWWDVLRRGRASRYAHYFDIDFDADPDGKLVLPVLGAPVEEILARGELRIVQEAGEPLLAYFDERFPLAERTNPAAGVREILDQQPYRPIYWREGAIRRNYRRFFNIDQLAGLRVDDPEVFEASHALILDLAGRGLIQGLRVDHVDGLADPKAYLDRLQRRLTEVRPNSAPFYIWVEKILIGEERLPEDWPVAGTTGYEFMNEILGVLVARPGLDALAAVAERFIGSPQDFGAIVGAAKREVLAKLFAGELAVLARRASAVCGLDEAMAADALRRLLVAFPVYRTYAGTTWSARDIGVLEEAFDSAGATADDAGRAALDQLEHGLAAGAVGLVGPLLLGLQQLSGPLMAKSVEDTAFYRFHRLLALNEVGGVPDTPGMQPEAFHRVAAWRLDHWPDTLLATATHDTKRGEDARARLAVLSEVPEAWAAAVGAWRDMNAPLPPIHPADEYALYQSLVGTWPPELAPDDATGLRTLGDRMEGWLTKALREGKERSDWNDPDHEYEGRALSFLREALRPARPFVAAVSDFIRRIEPAAAANGLAQLLVKLTAPGIPDLYQGTEKPDFSLVDPDNRRPVDFVALARALEGELPAKLKILRRALALRARHPDLFARGRYHPLAVEGELARHVLAFGRVLEKRLSITVVGRHLGQLLISAENVVLPSQSWANTAIALPRSWGALPLRDLLCDAEVSVNDGRLSLAPLLSRSPVALLSTC